MAGALVPIATQLAGPLAKAGLSYLSSEIPTLVKYLGKAHLLNGDFTPKQVIESLRERVMSKEGRKELLAGGQKAVKVANKIGQQGLSFANKLGLGGSLTRRLKESLGNKTMNIHEALGHLNKVQENYF